MHQHRNGIWTVGAFFFIFETQCRTQLYTSANFLYQKLSNTADESNCTILIVCIRASFWCKSFEHVHRIVNCY